MNHGRCMFLSSRLGELILSRTRFKDWIHEKTVFIITSSTITLKSFFVTVRNNIDSFREMITRLERTQAPGVF